MLTDIEIAQQAEMEPIKNVAAKLGMSEDDIEMYGKYKAKISDEYMQSVKNNENGKLILVTAINDSGRRGKDNSNRRTWSGNVQAWKEGGHCTA